jgi:hypothetical protein
VPNGYLVTWFVGGRSIDGPDDFNAQLDRMAAEGERRRVRVLGCSPKDRIEAAMLTLPPVAHLIVWRRSQRRLGTTTSGWSARAQGWPTILGAGAITSRLPTPSMPKPRPRCGTTGSPRSASGGDRS